MTERDRSPKRVHILASINPFSAPMGEEGRARSGGEDEKRATATATASPTPEAPPSSEGQEGQQGSEKDGERRRREPRVSKFRFKSDKSKSHRRSHRERDGRDADESASSSHRRHHRSSHHHHTKRRRRSRSPPAAREQNLEEEAEDPFAAPPLDPDAAFRESLFDAMADDEGAAYWEGVYGQPVHVYAAAREQGTRVNPATGELERMTDDEYAAYVRQKMWERTHAGLLEERERRAAERAAREREAAEAARIRAEVERSLAHGEERRRRRRWRDRWRQYADAWARWDGAPASIPWPVESGDRRDVAAPEPREGEREGGRAGAEAVRAFFVRGLDLEQLGEKDFAARLRDERVRWHPDKVQQRLGGGGHAVDPDLMKDVTAVFQVIDRLWSETRAKAG